jgi:hypothetical protein
LVPSQEVQNAPQVNSKGKPKYRIQNSLAANSKGRWAKYFVKKADLANKLLEKFEEIDRYIR